MKYKDILKNSAIIIIITVIMFFIGYSLFNYKTTTPYEFPIYQTQEEFDASSWKTYIEGVYKNSPSDTSDFPLDLSNFSLLYTENLGDAGICIRNNEIYDNICTLQNNTINSQMNWASTSVGQYWLRKLPPFKCFSNNTYVEVFHSAGDPIGDGTWFYATEGSGVWFDVGKTICFKKHNDAIKHFLGRNCGDLSSDFCDPYFGDMIIAAGVCGYKSIQFTEHGDQVCGLRAMEIVHVQGTGFYNCGFDPNSDNFGTSVYNTFKTGWDKTIGCSCDSTKANLNCYLSS
jgi:hypothetical protein